jgi:predicted  nucleic acid-binding Zn-ribbon protein
VDAATAKSTALLCQTRQKKEIAELNDRIAQLNEDVERGRLDQGMLRSEVVAQRRARERGEERLEAAAHHIEALRDSNGSDSL